jgi:germination protein M
MAARRRNDKRTRSNAGTVFWLGAIIVVLFIFALNWGKIQETLARTNFHEIVKTQTGADKNPSGSSGAAGPGATPEPGAASGEARQPESRTGPVAQPQGASPSAAPAGRQPLPAQPSSSDAASSARDDEAIKAAAAAAAAGENGGASAAGGASGAGGAPVAVKTRSASLFFVRIDDDGMMVRQEVKRQIAVSDSPLLDSLAALLKGPSEAELSKSLVSLVPQGTKLLSAQVRGSTAFLNFNEAFMYNHYGIEGYAGQLKQVVYTATSFPAVQDVQILIEGEKHDYLGGEGVYIGKPLSRNSF